MCSPPHQKRSSNVAWSYGACLEKAPLRRRQPLDTDQQGRWNWCWTFTLVCNDIFVTLCDFFVSCTHSHTIHAFLNHLYTPPTLLTHLLHHSQLPWHQSHIHSHFNLKTLHLLDCMYKTHTLFLSVLSSWGSSNWAKRRNYLTFQFLSQLNKKPPKKKQLILNSGNYEARLRLGQKFTHHLQREPMKGTVLFEVNNYFRLFAKWCDSSPDERYFRVALNPVSRNLAFEFRFAKPPWWLLSACITIRFCLEAMAASMADDSSWFFHFQFSNGLAASVFVVAPILWWFFLFFLARSEKRNRVFKIDLRKKVTLCQSRLSSVKQLFLRFFVHISTFIDTRLEKSVTRHFRLGM